MPILREFDTRTVRPPHRPETETRGTLNFPRPFVAPPRLAHGLRQLDMGRNANIRIRSTIHNVVSNRADCTIASWSDTNQLHSAVDQSLVLAPAELEFLTGEHRRSRDDPSSVRINFERPFVTPPKVVAFFNMIDLDRTRNWRLRVTATDIDTRGFTLNITTWADTIFHAAQVGWVAYPEDRQYIFSTSVNTTDIRPAHLPQHNQNRRITFGDVELWRDPSVFIALNYIDIGCSANLRVDAFVEGVSRTGLTWHINSWADTTLHAAGASIIAFN